MIVLAKFDPPFLIVSATHDYRTKRRVDLHFIADELVRRGETMFLSTHLSPLSRLKSRDRRLALAPGADRAANGVETYLWRAPLHPLNVRPPVLDLWNRAASWLYGRAMPVAVTAMIARARTIIVESGGSVALIDDIARCNPQAAIIYSASDTLATIGMARFYDLALCRAAPRIAFVRLPSARMANDHACIPRQRVIPHGLDKEFFADDLSDPYERRPAAVSVGSMLFDPAVLDVAARAFPQVDFHVIGSGHDGVGLGPRHPNLHWISEMEFGGTIPYIRHADIGMAPYHSALDADYLVDTSMKLMQFEAAGVPAVCPTFAQGGRPSRFGYTVGDADSIVSAVEAALAQGRGGLGRPRTWAHVVEEMLAPLDEDAIA
ncbi:hypothetical protein [Sphingomonas aquatilis]|uniref:GumK N-terminal domain-containing glycosyltransferase n=1 Tax=Sphingomonas aquatilis TaxID=93063 RepID=UPI0023F6469B|nr:hypothetical protein [Sphingomonas aquatilis]